MTYFDINADIVPGVSIAGYRLGEEYKYLENKFIGFEYINKSGGYTLYKLIREKENFIIVNEDKTVSEIYISYGELHLQFDDDEKLSDIFVGSIYKGKFNGVVTVGSTLEKVLEFMDLEFNEFDDVYFSVNAFDESGNFSNTNLKIGFLTDESEGEDVRNQIIRGFWIFS